MALAELAQLNEHKQGKKRLESRSEMENAALAILDHHRSNGLVKLTITEQVPARPVRAYAAHTASVRSQRTLTLLAEVDAVAVQEATRSLGWRIYATHSPLHCLSLEQAVLA